MKWPVFALVLLALLVAITRVQVDSNTEYPLHPMSEAEMLTTQGAGDCQRTILWFADDSGCSSTGCETYWSGNGWVSKKRNRFSYGVCGGSSSNTRCYKTNDRGQDCAVEWRYVGPYCQSWFWDTRTEYISTYNRTTVPGCSSSGSDS